MDRASSEEPAVNSEEARNLILEVARNRPGTHVAKCIQAYDEQQDLGSLVGVLEELSKNTDFSTDLRITLGYYTEDLLRHCLGNPHVSRRSAFGAAGSALQYCGKVYGDRVDYMYQVVEHQIEDLLISQPQKEPTGENNGPENAAPKPEEPRKRRAKKLTKKEVDPYLLTMEPRRFKTMSDEKRFSTTGFVKCTRNRTIEYLYQDHMPPNLWRHAPIVDPQNPLDLDEKKQYKMFTYHVEHRYNTLLPDIPFERLNLIKEYVHTNQVNTSEILNEHMTTKDYLDEVISLENQMLASRYGATVRTRRRVDDQAKRSLDAGDHTSASKRVRLDEDQAMELEEAELTEAMEVEQPATGEDLENPFSMDSGMGELINSTQVDSTINCRQEVDCSLGISQVEESSQGVSQSADSAIGNSQGENSSQMENSSLSVSQEENCSLSVSQVEDPPLSSTFDINDSSVLDSIRLDFPPVTEDELLQIDVGIGMDDVSDSHHTGQSFDDEGVVLSDCEDQQQRIDKVRDAALKDTSEIQVASAEDTAPIIVMHAEEPVDVPREVCYPVELNIFRFPLKHLRRQCNFKLPKEYDIFTKARLPTKRGAKTPAAPRSLVPRVEKEVQTDESMDDVEVRPPSPDNREFDEEMNFLGFAVRRRQTRDSGLDDEERIPSRTVSALGEGEVQNEHIPVNENAPIEAKTEDDPSGNPVNENVPVEVAKTEPKTEGDSPGNSVDESFNPEVIRGAADGEEVEGLNVTIEPWADTTEPPENSGIEPGLEALPTLLDIPTIIDEAPAKDASADKVAADIEVESDEDIRSDSPMDIDNVDFTDSSTMIRDWHQRLAPTLEAAHARQNFNIKDLGTEILNVCEAGDKGKATLADVMADKDPSIMCRYMLASLVLANHGNVSLDFGNRDKSKPMEMSQFCMELKSTKRMEIHPEDDVGNMSAAAASTSKAAAATAKSKPAAKRKSTDEASPEVFAKTVRLIQPIPKISQSASDTDSGISSMCSSLASAPQGN